MELALSAIGIFLLRIGDVSIASVRIVTLMRGRIGLAALLGFFEALFWVSAAAIVFSNLDNPVRIVAFAGGFAAGTLLGGHIERWLAMGTALIRIVAPVETPSVANALRSNGFPVTVVNAEGRDGEVRVTFLVLPRRRTKTALGIVQDTNPAAFVTVEDIRIAEVARRQGAGAVRK
ncbi:MAG: DUF5698 domain-containing protein [Actinomycetota bacterium]|jgi:uncharacterized protein YebE (UPF0316 family)|nr:DUF5698 domain-containing protein [Actinomycetota bacterium]